MRNNLVKDIIRKLRLEKYKLPKESFIILCKLELVLQNIQQLNAKGTLSLKSIEYRLAKLYALKREIYGLPVSLETKKYIPKGNVLMLQDYLKNTLPYPLLDKWSCYPPATLSITLIERCGDIVGKLKEEEEKLKKAHTKQAKNIIAWSRLKCENQIIFMYTAFISELVRFFNQAYLFFAKHIPVNLLTQGYFVLCGAAYLSDRIYPWINNPLPINGHFVVFLGAILSKKIHPWVAKHVPISLITQYIILLSGITIGALKTHKNGLPSSLKILLLKPLCQFYLKTYESMRLTDDYTATVLPPPKYFPSPAVATPSILFLTHLVYAYFYLNQAILLGSTAGFLSSLFFVRFMKSWHTDLHVSGKDSLKTLEEKQHKQHLLSVFGFYVLGYLPAVYLYNQYVLFSFCAEALRQSTAQLNSQGCLDVMTQRSSSYMSPSFWWSKTISNRHSFQNSTGYYSEICECALNKMVEVTAHCELPSKVLLLTRGG